MQQMKFVSWNVNGLRACLNKGFEDFFREMNADIFCLQETKLQPEQVEVSFEGYHQYFNSANRKGYSGTAVFTKQDPISVSYDLCMDRHNDEGRAITLEFEDFYFDACLVDYAKMGKAMKPLKKLMDKTKIKKN